MSLLSFSLVVLAAFVHATWNLLAKRAAVAGPAFVFLYTGVACVAYLPLLAWLLVVEPMPWNLPVLGCIVLSGGLHLAYSLALQRGYQVADLSVVYPIARGSAPLLSTLGAIVLLGEPVSAAGLLGLLAIVAGIFLLSTQGRPARLFQPEALQGARWGGLTGATIAGYTVVDASGVKLLGIHPVVLDWFGNFFRFVTLAPWVLARRRGAWDAMKSHWKLGIAVGLLSPLSYILVLSALKLGASIGQVAPTREMSMMVGALFGWMFLREPVGLGRALGCGLLLTGVVVLNASG